jgi:hypothetical protein
MRRRPDGGTGGAVECRRVPSSPDVIMVAVRWSLHDGLSYQDVEELLAKLG